jgi:DNA-binding SARP family transcriptional activator/tetratricopeptide (TPR) repeat protein
MSRLRLAWLGAPTATHAGQPVNCSTRKTLALLIYLSANADLHPREKLTALLWPESDGAQGRASLRRSLAFLRRALGEAQPGSAGRTGEHLLVERDAIGFNFDADCTLDLQALQAATQSARQVLATGPAGSTPAVLAQLQAAAQLYRGDFLEGFSLKDAPGFDEWAGAQREYWRRQAVGLLDRLSQLLAEAGDNAAASEAAARWAAIEPLDDRAVARWMQLHLAHGDGPAALTMYEAYRQRLAAELRVEPAPETQALAERIRAGRPQGPAPAQVLPALGPRLAAKPLEAPLVGRAFQFGQLVEAYHLARAGGPQVIILQGEAGIGKPRLAAEFLGWAAAQGASVLQGRAFETGGALPYQLVVEALRGGLSDPAVLRGRLTDIWLSELARLLPELREAFPDLVVRPAEDAAQAQLFEAVTRLGETLARRAPLVLFLDDIQWAEAASLDLLHYVGRRWVESGAPVLIVAGLRDEAAQSWPGAARWLAGVARDMPLRRLPLALLTPPDTLKIVEALGVDQPGQAGAQEAAVLAGFSRWLFGETAGQPLFIIETLKALLDRGLLVAEPMPDGARRIDFARAAQPETELRGLLPPGVRELIRSRLTRLPPAALTLLSAAAVLDRQSSFDRMRQVSGLNEDQALAALELLLAGRLLRPAAPDRYTFSHDKIRDVVYTEAGLPRQQVYHRRALELLAEAHAPASELAHHARQAGLTEPASRYAVAAGDDALAVFAARDAIAHYEQALTYIEGDKARALSAADLRHLHAQLGRAYDLNGELEKAQHAYERLLALAEQAGDAHTQRLALNRLAILLAQAGGNFPRALALLQQALSVAEASGDTLGLAETEWNLAQMGFYTWDAAHVLEHARRALRLAEETGGRDLIARSHNVLGLAHWVLGRFEESERHSRLAQQLYAELGNRIMEADSQCVLAEAQIRLGQAPAAIDTARLVYATGRELQNPWGQIGAACRLSLALKETGQLEAAAVVADDAVTVSRAVGAPHWLVIALCLRGAIYRDLEDHARALAVHQDAQAVAEGRVSPIFKALPGAHLCADYAALGDWGQAARWVPAPPSWGELMLCQGLLRWYAIETRIQQGQQERATADVRAFEALVGDNRRYRIPYLRCQAVLAAAGGQLDTAAAHLRDAAALAQQMGLPIEERNARAALSALV